MQKSKKAKLICQIAFYVIFFATLLLVVGMFISKATGKVFFIFDRASVWVLTDSMEDEIPASSYIRIKRVDPAEIKEGDIITFYSDDPALKGSLNTHRVVGILEGGKEFETKGDNNLANDHYTAKADKVVGIYDGDAPLLTAFGRFFQTKIGLFSVFAFVIVLTAFTFFSDLFKKDKKEEDKTEDNK